MASSGVATGDATGRRTRPGLVRAVRQDASLRSLALAVVVAVVIVLWAGKDAYRGSLVIVGAAYALIALGLYVPFVICGRISLAYGAYALIGGYAVGLVSKDTSLPVPVGWLIGAVVAGALAALLAIFTSRLSNWYLAAVTILFATAFESWATNTVNITGGVAGISGIRPFSVAGTALTGVNGMYAAVALVLVIGLLLDRLRLSGWGRLAMVARDHPTVVQSAGVRVSYLVVTCLALGGAVSALGGSLFTAAMGSVTPVTFTMEIVFLALFMPLLGGVGSAWGAALGAVIVVQLTQNSPALGSSGLLILGVGVVAILLLAPSGLLTMLDRGRRALLASRRGRTVTRRD